MDSKDNAIVSTLEDDAIKSRIFTIRGVQVMFDRDLAELYETRRPRYERFADHIVDNNGSAEETVRRIMELLEVEA